jgi:hypothetical protein
MFLKILVLLTLLSLSLAFTSKNSTLGDGQTLNPNEYLNSTKGYVALMQEDGNFVLYSNSHFVPKNALWSSKTNNKGQHPRRVVMQNDGNLVVYDVYNVALWSSGTFNKGAKPHRLVMQDDGNLVIYDGNNRATWATGTNRHHLHSH